MDTIYYPIYGRNKEIRCYTLIERRDLARVSKHSWSLMGRAYVKSRINGKDIYLHRFISKETNPDIFIDHINGDKLDNRRGNLRKANRMQNAFNRRKSDNKSSQYKGVCFDKSKNKWQAYVKMNGIKHLIGYFEDEMEAAKAYDLYASKYYGKYALLNF